MSGAVAIPAALAILEPTVITLAGAAITAGVGYGVTWLRARHANTLFVQAVQLAGGVAYNSMVAAAQRPGTLNFTAARTAAVNEGIAAAGQLATLATTQFKALPVAVDGALGGHLAADPTISAGGGSWATATAGPGETAAAVAGAGQGADAPAATPVAGQSAPAQAAIPAAPAPDPQVAELLDQVRKFVAAQPAPAVAAVAPALPAAWAATADTLARTIWAEARTEGELGMEAVANVVVNRAHHPRWWGKDVLSVCQAPKQFSCWNADDPQHEMIRAVTAEDPLFRQAQRVAAEALIGTLPDHTNGADHYVNLGVDHPDWAKGKTPCAVIGHHTFFRLEIPAPAAPASEPGTVPAAAAPAPEPQGAAA